MTKLTVSAFVKMLTGSGIQLTRAMELTSKLFKTYNTQEHLEKITDANLNEIGITRKEERKQILKAVQRNKSGDLASLNLKRKRDEDLLRSLPIQVNEEAAEFKSLEFKEVTDEAELQLRNTVINRAPIMAAWAMIVAEALDFRREEALSIASAFTEMNALSKSASLGTSKKENTAADVVLNSSSQPYVDFMGRRIPLLKNKGGQWRAISADGVPVSPGAAFSYISNALRQTTPYILGSMRLLASSFTASELNRNGFSLYASFRPQVERWGGRSTVKCKDILALRKKAHEPSYVDNKSPEMLDQVGKGIKAQEALHLGLSSENYEAALYQDLTT